MPEEREIDLEPEKIAALICALDKAIAALEIFANCDRQILYTRLVTLGHDQAARMNQAQINRLVDHHCGAKKWPQAV